MNAMDKVKNDENVSAPTRTIKRLMGGIEEDQKDAILDDLLHATVKATLLHARELTGADD